MNEDSDRKIVEKIFESDSLENKYTAACFDLDGTLIDTEPIHLYAESKCLEIFRVDPTSSQRPRTFGMGIEPGMRLLAKTFDLDPGSVLKTYTGLWKKGLQTDLQLMPGASTVLSWLSDHNVPIALVTSSDIAYVDLVDSVVGLKKVFSVVITCDTTERLKPDPMAYLNAAKRLDINPEFCVGFEDSGAGITALNSAGMFSVAIHPTHDSRCELQPAKLKVESLEKVEPCLAAWFC